jgi:hypothetical protein
MPVKVNLKSIAAAAVLGASALGASAQIVVPWGVHDSGELAGTLLFDTGSNFAFDLIYTFSLAAPQIVEAVGVTNDGGVFNITGAMAELYKSNGNMNWTDDMSVAAFAFDSTAITNSFGGLASGDYYYRVTGQVTGTAGGSYLLSSSLAPIPEPGTYALMLAGLAAVAGVASRRRRVD